MKKGDTKHYRSRYIYIFALLIMVLMLMTRYWDPYPVQLLRISQFDLYQNLSPRPTSDLPVLIVDIDEYSLGEIGQWPWPRDKLAQVLQVLTDSGAVVIGMDFVFAEQDRLSGPTLSDAFPSIDPVTRRKLFQLPDNDIIFANAIANSPSVLGVIGHYREQMQEGLSPPKVTISVKDGDPVRFVPHIKGFTKNLSVLEDVASGIGALTILPELDGVVRRIPTVLYLGDQLYPSFGIEMLRVLTGGDSVEVYADEAGIRKVNVGGLDVPTDQNGLAWVRFNKHAESRYLSAAKILNGTFDPNQIAGRIVLLGTSAQGLLDIKATPLEENMPGVEIWAQWIETNLFDKPIVRPDYIIASEYLILLLICLVLIFTLPRFGASLCFVTVMVIFVAAFSLSWYFYTSLGILLDVSYASLVAFLIFTALIFLNYSYEERYRRQIRNAFEHYVSPDLVDQIARDPDQLKLSGESREITVLFTDIEGFTRLVEQMDPQEITPLLNEYLDGVCTIVLAHSGTIDKIIGDAVMAIFGAPSEMDNHAEAAVKCAVALDKFCTEFVTKMRDKDIAFGITRIGVNTGIATVGNFGGNERFDYTVLGDTINTASRMEGANKYIGTRICVSGETATQCPNIDFLPIAHLLLKGKTIPTEAFTPVDREVTDPEFVVHYTKMFDAMQADGSIIQEQLSRLAADYPDYILVKFHMNRMKRNEKGVLTIFDKK